VNNAANTVRPIFYSVKLNQISIWTPPASQGANATCAVDWVGASNSPNREFSDTSVSVSTPAYVSCSPPPASLASFWQVPGSGTLCKLTAPTGSIIDVTLALILSDGTGETAIDITTVAAGQLGITYFLSLDPVATSRYTPVSLTTIV